MQLDKKRTFSHTAAKKSRMVQARCMYILVLAPCSNCGGSLCNIVHGFFRLVNEPAKPSKSGNDRNKSAKADTANRFQIDSIKRQNVSIMLHVCYEKKIGVKPSDSRNETGQQPERNRATTGMKPSSLGKQPRSIFGHYEVTTRFSFMNGSSFEPILDHFGRVRGCVPDSVSLRFEFVS